MKSPSPAPPASPSLEEARANDIAAKSETMARELSQKREMRIRQERVRHLSSDDASVNDGGASKLPVRGPAVARPASSTKVPLAEDKTVRQEDLRSDRVAEGRRVERRPEVPSTSPPFYPDVRTSIVDDVAVELEELMRDMRAGWRRFQGADRITMAAAVVTLIGVLLPWLAAPDGTWQIGLNAGGTAHAALAIAAIVSLVGRNQRYDARGERLAGRARAGKARRTSLWHLLLGAMSTLLCAYFLTVYGLQRSAVPGLQIKFGLYVTLAAGMGLSYGGFARFWGRHEGGKELK